MAIETGLRTLLLAITSLCALLAVGKFLPAPAILGLVHLTINTIYRVGAHTPLRRLAWSTWGAVIASSGFVITR